ncbi:hypothetical protein GF337_03380 [candidate division KSB1 bacterium]|nr:hypothetical protein [candidate division KSB1 bacterium]
MKKTDILYILIITGFIISAFKNSSAEDYERIKAKWLKQGIVDAGGSHEPYMFRIRRGGFNLRTDEWEHYLAEHSEENVKRLSDLGVNVYHTHFYKGFGMAAEMEEMERTKELAEIVHKYGMKIDTYLQWGSIMYETFFDEIPAARNWIEVDQFGDPILRYSNRQFFRYAPCINNENYKAYLKKVIRYAVEEVKTDFIHFDNFGGLKEPKSCHCPVCTQKFREYLKEKYDEEGLKQRFGFSNLNNILPPQADRWAHNWDYSAIVDPVIQEWIEFRCISLSNALREMAQYIKSLNPETVVEVNFNPGLSGWNLALRGKSPKYILPNTEVVWTEERNTAEMTEDGRLVSEIRSYKMARMFDNIAFTWVGKSELSLACGLAFNQTMGYIGELSFPPMVLRYLDFYKQNRHHFTVTTDVADVAILRSFATMTYNFFAGVVSTTLFEQTLLQAKIPFDIIFDQHLNDLSQYKVLVLANQTCLSDEQLGVVRQFVENGGGLVFTENTSLYNERVWTRPQLGLADLFDSETAPTPDSEEKEIRESVSKGRAVYIPIVQPAKPLPRDRDSFTSKHWYLPVNWRQLADAVRWAGNEDFSVVVEGPTSLLMNLVEQKKTGNLILHLLNFNANKPEKDIPVQITKNQNKRISRISYKSPDEKEEQKIMFTDEEEKLTFTVPGVSVYGIVVIE